MPQTIKLLLGDCKVRMAELPDGSIGSLISDPPYLLNFMGCAWDLPSPTSNYTKGAICGICDQGSNKCKCEEPAWFINGEPVEETISTAQMHENEEWHKQWLKEAFRLLPSGGVAKIFSATRTYHRLAAAMEAVGFKGLYISCWNQGQGFPKSLNLFKALQASGCTEEEAEPWKGYGTALKPSAEIFVCGHKP